MTTPSSISNSDKLWIVLSHLSLFIGFPFILPLIVYLVMNKESDFVATHAREALNFHITLLIYSLLCIPLLFILIGIPIMILLGIVSFICAIIACLRGCEGMLYRYPLTIRLI
jgi:uncharacterized Tic20 family protein